MGWEGFTLGVGENVITVLQLEGMISVTAINQDCIGEIISEHLNSVSYSYVPFFLKIKLITPRLSGLREVYV